VDAAEVDMIVGSMAGPLCAAGGFCAGSDEIVEHQRLSAAAYTYSAALPAMSATTASETLMILQTTPDLMVQLRENIKVMWSQLDPRSDWVRCTSAPENPIMLLVLKRDVVSSRRLTIDDQQHLMQDVVDEVRSRPRFEQCKLTITGARSRRINYACEESPCWSWRYRIQAGDLYTSPCAEGMFDGRTFEKRS
jgi:hypothetical protein